MAQARSLTSPYEIVDWTPELNSVPNVYGLTNELGLFRSESVSQNVVQFEAMNGTLALITDQYRGSKNLVSADDTRKAHQYALAHYPMDDALLARELVGKRKYGAMDETETTADAILRKMERIRKSHAANAEAAKMHTIVTGTQYAPNGTVSANFYTDFGVTRTSLAFSAASTGRGVIRDMATAAVDAIQLNILSGETPTSHVAICNPVFFDKMVNQAGVVDAWNQAQMLADINQNGFQRVGGYQQIVLGGVRFIRYLGFRPDGQPFVPVDKAYVVPVGTVDTFLSYFGPAERFGIVNTLGEELYLFSKGNEDETAIKLSSESNFVHLIRRPQCIVELTATA